MRRRTALLVAPLLALAGLGAVTPAQADGYGQLSGTVTNARTGEPVAGITVQALSDTDGHAHSDTTDELGHWHVFAPADTYRLGTFDWNGTYREQWAFDKPDRASADPVEVADSASVEVDFGLEPLPTITGRITDNQGNPVVGFCPQFFLGDPADFNNYVGGCTDDDGRYRMGVALPGTYRVLFRDYGMSFADQWYDGVSIPDTATAFTAGTTDVTGIDAVLQPQATITTRLTDTAGQPLQGCATAFDLKGHFLGNGCTAYDEETPTGEVTITHLPAGTYVVQGNDWTRRHVMRYLGGTRTAKNATRVQVATGESATVAPVVLPLGGSVAGVVTDRVTGAPVSGACVTTNGRWDVRFGEFSGENPGVSCTDENGRYDVFGLDAGSYPVEVADPKGTHANLFLPASPDSRGAKKYKVALGATTTLDAALLQGGTISGRITMADGTSRSSVCVVAWAAKTHEQIGTDGCTDENGNYTIVGLGTNTYKVEVYGAPDPYATAFYPGVASYKEAKSVTVLAPTATTGIDVVLHAR